MNKSAAPPTTPAQPPPGEDPAEKRRKRLLSYSVTNMVYSVLAVLVVVFALWSVLQNPTESWRRPAQVEPVAAYAASQADFPVVAPQGLGQEWVATDAGFDPVAGVATWRVGLVSPSQEYAGLYQAAEVTDDWRAEVLEDAGATTETVSVDGPDGRADWQVWRGPERTALVLEPTRAQQGTTVVVGSATEDELATLAGALEPVAP